MSTDHYYGAKGDALASDSTLGVHTPKVITVPGTGVPAAAYRSTTRTRPAGAPFTASSAAVVTVLPANPARIDAYVLNDSDKTMYVNFGNEDPTSSDYDGYALPGEAVERMPAGYTGIVKAIWASGPTGKARVSEFT